MTKSITRHLLMISCILCFLPAMLLLFAAASSSLTYLLIIVVPSILITAYAIVYIRNRLIDPLTQLTKETERLSSGNFSQPITYTRRDELGQFVTAFDQMRAQLYEQQQEQEQFEIDRKNFINSISHDLKTPIASISAYVEALQDKIAVSPEEERHYLKVIENKLIVLTELSKQLGLSYAEPENLYLAVTPVNCRQWLTAFFSATESECQVRGIKAQLIDPLASTDTSVIKIDRYQLDRAIQNILNNAYRYTQNVLSIAAEISANEFRLCISNDGVTVADKNAEKIFERFYTENGANDQGHLGLGLSISKTIIQSMGGQVSAKIASGIITFELAIPLVATTVGKEGDYSEQ